MAMRHIASLSYGKDSLAMLEAIYRLGYPLDEIVHVEIWATDTISANLPPVIEFKRRADRIIKERYGLEVRHVCATNDDGSKRTFEKMFYRVPPRRKNKKYDGLCLGWPMLRGRWCLRALKLSAMPKHGADEVWYIGIAADETARINNDNNAGSVMPLVDIGWIESDAMAWCMILYHRPMRHHTGMVAGFARAKTRIHCVHYAAIGRICGRSCSSEIMTHRLPSKLMG